MKVRLLPPQPLLTLKRTFCLSSKRHTGFYGVLFFFRTLITAVIVYWRPGQFRSEGFWPFNKHLNFNMDQIEDFFREVGS